MNHGFQGPRATLGGMDAIGISLIAATMEKHGQACGLLVNARAK